MFLGSRALPVRRADNLTARADCLDSRQCGTLTSQPYRPPRPVTEIALLFFYYIFTLLLPSKLIGTRTQQLLVYQFCNLHYGNVS
jgi:hypothetical protein